MDIPSAPGTDSFYALKTQVPARLFQLGGSVGTVISTPTCWAAGELGLYSRQIGDLIL